MFAVRRADDLTSGRTSGVHQAFEFQRGQNVGVSAIAVFLQLAWVEHVITSGEDNSAYHAGDRFTGLH